MTDMSEKRDQWISKVIAHPGKIEIVYPFGVRIMPKDNPRKYLTKREDKHAR